MKYSFRGVLTFFFFVPIGLFAQREALDSTAFCCLYTHYVQTTNKDHVAAVDSFYSILEVGERIQKYGDLSSYVQRKSHFPEALQTQSLLSEDCRIDEHLWVLQNYPEKNKLTVREALHPSWFFYEETLDTLNWQLLPGDSILLDYACRKARVRYAGRVWTAWYANDIPVSSGPWKLTGLPGLILFAYDDTGTHTFQAYAMFNVRNQAINAESDHAFQHTKRDKFIKTRNQIKTDPKWVTLPWYNDEMNARIAILTTKSRHELGIAPFVSVNGIKYPCYELEDGRLVGSINCFQPLELY